MSSLIVAEVVIQFDIPGVEISSKFDQNWDPVHTDLSLQIQTWPPLSIGTSDSSLARSITMGFPNCLETFSDALEFVHRFSQMFFWSNWRKNWIPTDSAGCGFGWLRRIYQQVMRSIFHAPTHRQDYGMHLKSQFLFVCFSWNSAERNQKLPPAWTTVLFLSSTTTLSLLSFIKNLEKAVLKSHARWRLHFPPDESHGVHWAFPSFWRILTCWIVDGPSMSKSRWMVSQSPHHW